MNTLYHLLFDMPDDPAYGLLKAYAVSITIPIVFLLIILICCLLLQKLCSKIDKWILISDIKENPKNADKLIENSDCDLDDEFYQKYASKSLQLKREFQNTFDNAHEFARHHNDDVAHDKFHNLKEEYDKIQLDAESKAQQSQMEVLTNKASQALDEVWD